MKNLDLNAFGVQEMKTSEMQITDGGDAVDWVIWGVGAACTVGGVLVSGPVGWALFGPTAAGMIIAGALRMS